MRQFAEQKSVKINDSEGAPSTPSISKKRNHSENMEESVNVLKKKKPKEPTRLQKLKQVLTTMFERKNNIRKLNKLSFACKVRMNKRKKLLIPDKSFERRYKVFACSARFCNVCQYGRIKYLKNAPLLFRVAMLITVEERNIAKITEPTCF